MHIFIDESGDLGYTNSSTEFYVIGFVIVPPEEDSLTCIDRVFSKTRQKMNLPKTQSKEFHHNKCKIETRKLIFQGLSKCNVDFAYLILDKKQVYEDLKLKQEITNNFLVGKLLIHVLRYYQYNEKIKITVDKRIYTKELEREFSHYISVKVVSDIGNGIHSASMIKINHLSSHTSSGIQAADFIASGTLRYYRGKDEENHFEIFDKKVKVALNFFNGPIKGV